MEGEGEQGNKAHLRGDETFIREGLRDNARYTLGWLWGDLSLWKEQYNRAYQNLGWIEDRGFGRTTRSIVAAPLTLTYVVVDIIVISIGITLLAIDYVWRALDNLVSQIGRRLTRLIKFPDIGGGIRLKVRLPSKFRL